MSAIQTLLNSEIVHCIGITLLHSLWEGAAILALLSLLMLLMKKASPQKRYVLASAAMLLLIASPIVTFSLMSGSRVPTPASAFQPKASNLVDVRNTQVAGTELNSPEPVTAVGSGIAASQPPKSFGERYALALPWVVVTWLAGVLCLALWNFGGWIALQQMRFVTAHRAGEDVEHLLMQLSRRLSIVKPVRVLTSTLAKTPMVIGALKPMILLPASAIAELSIAELESIIAHELAHIRRHDFVINLLQAVVETILFYHPAVWLVSARVRQERENCCDDLALSVTRDRASYIRALAAVASVRVTSLVPAASGGRLLPRLQRLLGVADASVAKPSRWSAGAIVLTLIISAALFTRTHGQATVSNSDDDIVWIHGHVIDPDGNPVAAAKVMTTGYSFTSPVSEAVSAADGSYKISYHKSAFADVRFGGDATIVVAATAPKFGPGWAKPDHATADGELLLKLAKDDVPLEGRLIDTEGTPVAGARVRVWSIHAKATDLNKLNIMRFDTSELPGDVPPDLDAVVLGDTRYTTTDKEGRFKLTGLGRDRTIDLMYTGNGLASSFMEANTQPTPTQTRSFQSFVKVTSTVYGSKFDFIVLPGRTLSGTVRDAVTHEPLAGVKLERGRVGEATVTDARGHYEIAGIGRDDRITMTAVPPDTQPYLMRDIDEPVKPGNEPIVIDIELHRGVVITGRVTSMTTAKPVRSMQIEYMPRLTNKAAQALPEFRGARMPGRYGRYYSKGDGTFRIIGLPGQGVIATSGSDDAFCNGAGAEFLKCPLNKNGGMAVYGIAFGPMSYIAVKDIDIADGQQQATADLQCNPGVTVQLSIVDAEGKPVTGALVFRTAPNQPTRRFNSSTVDIVALGPKEKRSVQILHRNRLIGKIVSVSAADIPSRKLTVQLEPLSTTTGRLIGRDGQPITNALVQGSMEELLPTGTDSDGRFKLMLIPGRPSNIRGIKGFDQFLTDARNLVIAPGETKDLGDVHVN